MLWLHIFRSLNIPFLFFTVSLTPFIKKILVRFNKNLSIILVTLKSVMKTKWIYPLLQTVMIHRIITKPLQCHTERFLATVSCQLYFKYVSNVMFIYGLVTCKEKIVEYKYIYHGLTRNVSLFIVFNTNAWSKVELPIN